jgi:hypothetical protein
VNSRFTRGDAKKDNKRFLAETRSAQRKQRMNGKARTKNLFLQWNKVNQNFSFAGSRRLRKADRLEGVNE